MSIDTSIDRIPSAPGSPADLPRSGGDLATDVHVVGGGLGGLAAAALVAAGGARVTVHEQRRELGGRAATHERRGYRFNQGPHAFYLGGEGQRVMGRLGIVPAGVPPRSSSPRMARGGELHVAPGGPGSLARTRLLGARDKVELAAVMARLPRIDGAALADVTVREWIDGVASRRRVRDVLEALVRLSTYVHAPHHLSADVAVGQLQTGVRHGVRYLDGGWQQIVDRLAAMPGVRIEAGAPIRTLDDLDDLVPGGVGGRDGAAVIVAVGGPRATAAVTGHQLPAGPEATAATLDLGLVGSPACSFVIGVDDPMYLSEHGVAVGMVPAGGASVSLARYHEVQGLEGRREATGDTSDRERLRAFARLTGIADDQVVEERYLHRMSVVTSIATAATGGLAGRPAPVVPGERGVFVVGDWVGRRGHLADAVLASAEEAAEAALAHVRQRSVVR